MSERAHREDGPGPREPVRAWAEVALFAFAYLALVDLAWRFLDGYGRPIYWFPEGLAIGVLLRVDRRRWPAFLGAIPAVLFLAGAAGFPEARTPPPAIHVVWALENTAVPFGVAYALERAVGRPVTLTQTRQVVALVIASLLVVPAVGAVFELPLWWLWPSGRAAASPGEALLGYLSLYSTPVLGLVPVIVTFRRGFSLRAPGAHRLELGAMVLLVALLTGVSFVLRGGAVRFVALSFAAFPLLGWAASRFGIAIASQGAFALSIVGTWLTLAGHGPFGGPSFGAERLVFIQGLHAIATITSLIVAAEATTAKALAAEREAAVRLRDDFLSIASHELKTPLTPLSVRLQRLRRQIAEGLPLDVSTVDRALASLDRLTLLINDLLDASRIEREGLSIRPAPVDLTSIVREAARAAFIGAIGHELRLELPPAPVTIEADGPRITQVVENLVANAIKYSPRGGAVDVRLEERAEEVELSVSDEGIGIPTDQLPGLFERFFRARNASLTSYGGLGLGLYIVRDIVARHGGRLRAESVVGRGSTFHVVLPRGPAGPEATSNVGE